MPEIPGPENGYVACARCETAGCKLAEIPELAEDCSAMQGVASENVLDYALAENAMLPSRIKLSYDWGEQDER